METKEAAHDLRELLAADIRTELPADAVAAITSQPPFVNVPGIFNLRDLGGAALRPGFAYRSGALTGISAEGKEALRALGVGAIFDLRNPGERARHPSPAIEGVETVWEPYTRDPDPVDPKDFSEEDGGVAGFVGMYAHILEISTPVFRKVFEHVRDRPQQPFLFHCTSGKDRTGVLAALILLLVESPSKAIVHDYLLSRVGVEPFRNAILGSLLRTSSGAGPTLDDPGVRNIFSVRPGTMVAFIKAVDERFGGVRGYLTKELGFSSEDVDAITANLKAAPKATMD